MASPLHPISQVRLRRALGLAAAVTALGLGSAPAISAPLDGLLTPLTAPDQPARPPSPGLELRPIELPPILDPLPLPVPAPVPAPELAPLLDPVLGVVDEVVTSTLSSLTGGSPSAPAGQGTTAPAADPSHDTGSASSGREDGVSGQGPIDVRPAAPGQPRGTVTAATLMPIVDAVSGPVGPSGRSRRIAAAARSGAPGRVAPLGLARRVASTRSAATPGAAPQTAAGPAAAPSVRHSPAPAPIPRAAQRVVRAVAVAGRSPWLLLALLVASAGYVLGQRLMDGGSKLSHAGRGDEPDDELIEL